MVATGDAFKGMYIVPELWGAEFIYCEVWGLSKNNIIFAYLQTANTMSDSPSQLQLLALSHHVEWATLGFTRAIASSPAMCRALSTPAWVHLLLSVVGGQDNTIVITLPKQVCRLLTVCVRPCVCSPGAKCSTLLLVWLCPCYIKFMIRIVTQSLAVIFLFCFCNMMHSGTKMWKNKVPITVWFAVAEENICCCLILLDFFYVTSLSQT